MRVKKWITNNLGLKILSLILAIVTWFYINEEFTRRKNEEEKAIFSMLHYDVILKKLPIQLTIVGQLSESHEIVTDNISIDPKTCIVIGPKRILDDISFVRTVPIDVSEYTKDINSQIALAPIASGISLQDEFVKVYIPIIKKAETAGAQKSQDAQVEPLAK